MPARFLPNINWVRAVVCPAVVLIATGMDRGYQTDFWHHLARGRAIAQAGRVVDVEQFTFTVAGSTVRDANWLTQLAYFRLFELGGMPLVQFANSCVLAAAAALLVWSCRRRSGGSAAVAMGVSLFVLAGIWQTLLIRPQSVSLLLFVALHAILLEAERRRWLLLLPPVLMALWANVHGGFPIGLVLIGAFVGATLAERWSTSLRRRLLGSMSVGGFRSGVNDEDSDDDQLLATPAEAAAKGRPPRGLPFAAEVPRSFGAPGATVGGALRIRGNPRMLAPLLLCLTLSVAATLLNPYGFRVYEYVFTLSNVAAARQIEEWLPPSMGLWVGRAWAASIVLLVALLAFARRRPRARDLFVALCFLPLACSSVRMVPWWLLALAPVLASAIGQNLTFLRPATGCRTAAGPCPRLSWAALAMLMVVAGAVALSTPWLERVNPVLGTLRPEHRPESDLQTVLAPLQVNAGGARVFTRLEWGEYLDWAAYPRVRSFMDGRIEIYPDDVWDEYLAVSAARADWQSILDARQVDYLLLDATYHGQLLAHVRASGRWERVGVEGPAHLFARRGDGVAITSFHDAP